MNEEIQPESPIEAAESSEPEATTAPSRDDCNMGALCHLLSFAAPIVGNVVGPLIIWLMKKDDSEYVNDHGIRSINFQVTMTIIYFVCFAMVFVVDGLAILLIPIVFNVVLTIIAAVSAQKGERYEYPFSIKFLS